MFYLCTRAGLPVSPYEAVDALMQQQKTSMGMSTSPTIPQAQPQQQPRIRGRMTPYAFFVMERREFYRRQGLPVQFAAFSKECSNIWKSMTEEQKQKYQKLAEEDRERYQREISGGYVKPLAKDGTRRGRKKKEPGQPKRNMLGKQITLLPQSLATKLSIHTHTHTHPSASPALQVCFSPLLLGEASQAEGGEPKPRCGSSGQTALHCLEDDERRAEAAV